MASHQHSGGIGLVVALSSLLAAQKPANTQDPQEFTPAPAAQAAWQDFVTEAGGQWLVRWHPPTGTPKQIYGNGYELDDWRENSLAEARRHANLGLERWPELLGLGNSTFTERHSGRMGRTWSLTFDQSFGGLPVLHGRVDFRVHMIGKISFLGSQAVPIDAEFNTMPGIAETVATAIAWQTLGLEPPANPQPGVVRKPRLVIWTDQNATAIAAPVLAWEVPISAILADGSGPAGRVYIDAKTGGRLDYINDKHECGFPNCRYRTGGFRTGDVETSGLALAGLPKAGSPLAGIPLNATYTVMAYLHTGYDPTTTPTNEPLVGVEVDVPGHGTLVTDQNGQFTVTLTQPTTVTVDCDGIHCQLILGTSPLTDTLQLMPGVNQTFQLGAQNSTANELAHTTVYYWTYQINQLLRSVLGNTPELAIADDILPTVNITNSCNAFYTNNTMNFYHAAGQCNNTASASVTAHEWGHGLDDRYGGISQTNGLSEGWADICSHYMLDDPVIGHGFYTNGNGIRDGRNTRQYPGGSGPHAQGESWMGFAWKFRENLRAVFGTQQAITISQNTVLSSVIADAKNQADAVLEAFLADDDDANLNNGTPHHPQLSSACNQHNLPYPPILAGTVTHSPLQLTTNQLQPRRIEVDAVPTFGVFSNVEVTYDAGSGPQTIPMIPTGVQDRYQALLPGMLSPQVMSYHVTATHGGGVVYRLPEIGEYTYQTLGSDVIWQEDFESGGAGWTHGASTGTDDWEIGAPAGYSTPQWSDPGSAFSGVNCAGTDLTGDGAYSPSSTSWLRSPAIDCTGQINLRIRFKRWVSCPNTFGDSLELWCEGYQIWHSPYAPFVENTWVSYETQLWMADNNPSVELEFRLISDGNNVEYGGWNIDDIEIFTNTSTTPPDNRLTILPAQAQQGSTLTLQVNTPTSQPFLLILGNQPGPTAIAGLPPILVGGNSVQLFNYTDASGNFTLPYPAPASAPLNGAYSYSQVLTLTPNFEFVTSNQHINLFTQ
ncbi:MAG: hypothetical protein NXI31_03685 [bacterium]|nr:hypothetical protein [bacterium]